MSDFASNFPSLEFDGETFIKERDSSRLASQLADVRAFMSDGHWHSLNRISGQTGHPQASISARLRDLRKAKFGGHQIERRYWHNGLWVYRMSLPKKGQLSLGLM